MPINRKRQVTEEAPRKRELSMELFVKNSPFPIGIVNLQTNAMESVNAQFMHALGYKLEDIRDLDTWFLEAFPDQTARYIARRGWQNALKNIKQGHPIRPHAFEMTCKNGEKRTILFHVIPLEEAKNYVFLEDITENKKVDSKIQRLYEETIAISNMKSELITFISHELKTPLVPILGWVEFIKNSLERGMKIENLISLEEITSIFKSAMRLNRIITNFLDVQRIEADRLNLTFGPHPLSILLSNAIINVKDAALARGIKFVHSIEEIELNVDSLRIEQAFTNILSNGIKYSQPYSSINITSARIGDNIEIIFKDSGMGFTPEELRDAGTFFSPTGLHRKEQDPNAGAGVGLYIAKAIVNHHGGQVEISSEGRDKGSAIKVRLPIATGFS